MKNPNLKGRKLPIAGILYFIFLTYCAINIIISFIQIYHLENNLRVALGAVADLCFDCVLPFIVMVMLLLKMRNILLVIPFVASVIFQEFEKNKYIWDLYAGEHLHFGAEISLPFLSGATHYNVIHVLALISLVPFMFDVFFKVDSKYNKMLQKIWFIPGIMMTGAFAASFYSFTDMYLPLRISVFIIPLIFDVAIAFTLAYWITNPYKKGFVPVVRQKGSRQSVAYGQQSANVQPQYQQAAQQNISIGYCAECGNALEEGDKFCAICGAPVSTVQTSEAQTADVHVSEEQTTQEQVLSTQTPVSTTALNTADSQQIPAFRTNTAIPVGDSAINQRR